MLVKEDLPKMDPMPAAAKGGDRNGLFPERLSQQSVTGRS
jgi:hypothetical protein